jgi:hypothetical protein
LATNAQAAAAAAQAECAAVRQVVADNERTALATAAEAAQAAKAAAATDGAAAVAAAAAAADAAVTAATAAAMATTAAAEKGALRQYYLEEVARLEAAKRAADSGGALSLADRNGARDEALAAVRERQADLQRLRDMGI